MRAAVLIAAVLLVAQSAVADSSGWLDKPLLSLAPLHGALPNRPPREGPVIVPLSVTTRLTSS